jgi:hypothetical protein
MIASATMASRLGEVTAIGSLVIGLRLLPKSQRLWVHHLRPENEIRRLLDPIDCGRVRVHADFERQDRRITNTQPRNLFVA